MARKEIISRKDIEKAAFDFTREKGISELSARHLANYAGCSTQPIFRNFSGMEECIEAVFDEALLFFDEYIKQCGKKSRVPFVNLGMAYISFAMEEPKLFSFLFMTKNSRDMNMYALLNQRTGVVMTEMNSARAERVAHPEQIFMKMWMLIHGAACMTITGDYDLSDEETVAQLEEAYKAFVR